MEKANKVALLLEVERNRRYYYQAILSNPQDEKWFREMVDGGFVSESDTEFFKNHGIKLEQITWKQLDDNKIVVLEVDWNCKPYCEDLSCYCSQVNCGKVKRSEHRRYIPVLNPGRPLVIKR